LSDREHIARKRLGHDRDGTVASMVSRELFESIGRELLQPRIDGEDDIGAGTRAEVLHRLIEDLESLRVVKHETRAFAPAELLIERELDPEDAGIFVIDESDERPDRRAMGVASHPAVDEIDSDDASFLVQSLLLRVLNQQLNSMLDYP
jgi:hypothetical protein